MDTLQIRFTQTLYAALLFGLLLLVFGVVIERPLIKRWLKNKAQKRWWLGYALSYFLNIGLGTLYCAVFHPPQAFLVVHGFVAGVITLLIMPWESYSRQENYANKK